MKTAELTGGLLDYWTAYATDAHKEAHHLFPTMTLDSTFSGIVLRDYPRGEYGTMVQSCVLTPSNMFRQDPQAFSPSEWWEHGGPLIDKFDVVVDRIVTTGDATLHYQARKYPHQMTGPTYLIAAMRAVVASQFGDEVPDEVPA